MAVVRLADADAGAHHRARPEASAVPVKEHRQRGDNDTLEEAIALLGDAPVVRADQVGVGYGIFMASMR